MKNILTILIFVCFILGSVHAQHFADREIIRLDNNQENRKELLGLNLDLLMEKEGNIYIVASPNDLIALNAKNILYDIESHKFYPRELGVFTIQSGVNGDFHSYPELERDLMALADTYPDLAQVIDIGDSLEQRNIYAVRISDNVGLQENEASVIFLGCHHAREWISVEVPFLLGKYLVENYSTDEEVKRLVDNCDIWIVPLVNPDGLEYSIHFYRYWRKNMRDNGDGTYGVDLNRNYGYKWGWNNLGSSPDSASEVYRGPGPFTEPEIQAIRDLFAQMHFQALVSYHSYSQVILYPWGYTEEVSDKEDILFQIGDRMSRLMEPVNGRYYPAERAGAGFYLTNGDTTDWSFGVYGIPSYTIELPPDSRLKGEFFNAESDIHPIFDENLPAALYLVDWCIQTHASQAHNATLRGRQKQPRLLHLK
ncbi:MAG: zinc carboxypeptidase [Candidatus Aminicenantes bacterium]|nr:MAG: zinc carboxypeptidase [Candidatus Aminicenantes bacterium]